MPCFAPVVLLGMAVMFGDRNFPPPENAPQMEVKTCAEGLGAYASATTNQLYAAGVQWGIGAPLTESGLVLRFTPHFGVSHTGETIDPLPSYTQFDVGGGLYLEYQTWLIGFKVSHWSNGNYFFNWDDSGGRQNVGVNLFALQVGRSFR